MLWSVFNTPEEVLYRFVSAVADPELQLILPLASIAKFGVALLDGPISIAVSEDVLNFTARILL